MRFRHSEANLETQLLVLLGCVQLYRRIVQFNGIAKYSAVLHGRSFLEKRSRLCWRSVRRCIALKVYLFNCSFPRYNSSGFPLSSVEIITFPLVPDSPVPSSCVGPAPIAFAVCTNGRWVIEESFVFILSVVFADISYRSGYR